MPFPLLTVAQISDVTVFTAETQLQESSGKKRGLLIQKDWRHAAYSIPSWRFHDACCILGTLRNIIIRSFQTLYNSAIFKLIKYRLFLIT